MGRFLCASSDPGQCNFGPAAWRQVRRVGQDELVNPERAAILVEEYLAGATMREVSAHHGVSTKLVQRAMRQLGAATRTAEERSGYPARVEQWAAAYAQGVTTACGSRDRLDLTTSSCPVDWVPDLVAPGRLGVVGVLKQRLSGSGRITCTKAFEDSPMLYLPLARRLPIHETEDSDEYPRDRETAVGIQQLGGPSQRDDRLVQLAVSPRVGRRVVDVALDQRPLEFLDCHRDALDLTRAGSLGRATEGHVERPHFDGACCFHGTGNALLCEVPHAIPVIHVVVDDTVGYERRKRALDVWHSHAQPTRESLPDSGVRRHSAFPARALGG